MCANDLIMSGGAARRSRRLFFMLVEAIVYEEGTGNAVRRS